jgi:hypothetical protein
MANGRRLLLVRRRVPITAGQFTTKEEAETDAQRIGRNLLSVILDAADQDDNQRRANKLM